MSSINSTVVHSHETDDAGRTVDGQHEAGDLEQDLDRHIGSRNDTHAASRQALLLRALTVGEVVHPARQNDG